MKKLIASALLLLSIFSVSILFSATASANAPAFAETELLLADAKEYSSFDVFDIFSIDEDHETNAEAVEQEATGKQTSPIGVIILRAINILTLLIGTFAFVMIVIGGFMFSTSGGEQTRVDRAKAILTQSVAGLAIAFMSYLIVTFVQSFFY
jgi:hypothetical protein